MPDRELLDAAALCGHLVPAGSVAGFLAEHRDRLFGDELFADLFPSQRGRPSIPAPVVATVMVLQSLEGLSDRDACEQLRTNIAWKVAAGLSLADEGFHPTVLTLWRTRLRTSARPERVFDAVREVVAATGVLAGRHRRALDSTVLDDAVATQDTVTQLIAAIRRVLRVAPGPAAGVDLSGHDYASGAKPVIAWDDPAAKDVLVSGLVNDALALLAAYDGVALEGEAADAVGLLGLVAGQDVEPGDAKGTWRIARRTATDRVVSTVDPESRHAHKTRREIHDGYKAHVAIEPDTGLITGYALTAGNAADGPTGVTLAGAEPAGSVIYADTAYSAGPVRDALAGQDHTLVIKPQPLPRPVPGGFDRDDFHVDHHAGLVTCPAGLTATITAKGSATFGARCQGCALRDRCTTAKDGRTISVGEHDAHLVAARTAWRDPAIAADYRAHRPMVERTLAWVVAGGNRRLRYRGRARNHAWLAIRAATINLRRLINLGLTHNAATGWQLPTS